MTEYVISVGMTFDNPDGATDDDFEAFIDATVVAFGEVNEGDITVSASLANRTADFSIIMSGRDPDETLARYEVDLHRALHAACCASWVWFGIRNQTVRELQPVPNSE